MKLYVIRHGESEANLRRYYSGWSQIALTAKGIEDAKSVRPILEKVPFDKIYASDLIRSQQTADAALPGCNYEVTPLLREINVGNLVGRPYDSLTPEEKHLLDTSGYIELGGESREEFSGRIREFMKKAEELDCEYVAAFSHAGWLRGMLEAVIGGDITKGSVVCNNCTVAIFECNKGNWQLHSWINTQ